MADVIPTISITTIIVNGLNNTIIKAKIVKLWKKWSNHILDKRCISEIKKFYISIVKGQSNKKWTDNICSEKIFKWPTSTWKKCSTSLIIGEIPIKSIIGYHLTSSGVTKIKRWTIRNVGENVEKL